MAMTLSSARDFGETCVVASLKKPNGTEGKSPTVCQWPAIAALWPAEKSTWTSGDIVRISAVTAGGEPYLDLKWWLFGKEVWIYPEGLIRHAFGVNAQWRKVGAGAMTEENQDQLKVYFDEKDVKKAARLNRRLPPPVREQAQELWKEDKSVSEKIASLVPNWPKRFRNEVHTRHSGQTKWVPAGDEHLHYSRGYAWNNDQFQFNFMLSAFTIGGYPWLQQRYKAYYDVRKGNPRYIKVIKQLRHEVLAAGLEDRQFIASRQELSLDELLEKEPWKKFDDL